MDWKEVYRKLVIAIVTVILLPLLDCRAETINICFYFVGGDLEDDSGAASEDIKEILRSNRPEETRVYLLAGGATRWQLDEIEDGMTTWAEIRDGRLNMTEVWPDAIISTAEALTRFMKQCYTISPAEKTILIFWGHGMSGTRGIGCDLLNACDTLTLAEIRNGLADAGLCPDIIGFDACAMATLESSWILADCCDYLVACTDPEVLTGWRHQRWLSSLDGNMERVAHCMAEDYNDDCLRRGVEPSMQMLYMRGFREKMSEPLAALFEACPPPAGRMALSELTTGNGKLERLFAEALGEGDYLLGKYENTDVTQALELDGIGESYYRWLTTR